MCNLGSLNCSLAYPVKSFQNNNSWRQNDNGGDEDDMCLIDDENFLTFDGETRPILENSSDLKKVSISMIHIYHLDSSGQFKSQLLFELGFDLFCKHHL